MSIEKQGNKIQIHIVKLHIALTRNEAQTAIGLSCLDYSSQPVGHDPFGRSEDPFTGVT